MLYGEVLKYGVALVKSINFSQILTLSCLNDYKWDSPNAKVTAMTQKYKVNIALS